MKLFFFSPTTCQSPPQPLHSLLTPTKKINILVLDDHEHRAMKPFQDKRQLISCTNEHQNDGIRFRIIEPLLAFTTQPKIQKRSNPIYVETKPTSLKRFYVWYRCWLYVPMTRPRLIAPSGDIEITSIGRCVLLRWLGGGGELQRSKPERRDWWPNLMSTDARWQIATQATPIIITTTFVETSFRFLAVRQLPSPPTIGVGEDPPPSSRHWCSS